MRRPVIFVLLAGFAALVAAMVVYSALKRREAEVAAAKIQSVDIIVAAHELGIGSKLDASSVKTARWSRDSLPPGAFTDMSGVMDKYTMSSFVENEPITADRLFSGDKNAGVLPLLIPPGMRALSVPVDEVSDIAGFVLPHAHVDVLVSVTANDHPLSKIVLQDVEVLAIAQDIEQVGDKPQVVHVVTMLVTPDQAERLTLASGQGGLRLALRNYDDKAVVATDGITVAQLLGSAPMAAPEAVQEHMVYAAPRPRARPVSVEVMRNGSSTESVSFIRTGASHGEPMEAAPPVEDSQPASDPDAQADPEGKGDSSDSFAADAPSEPASNKAKAGFANGGSAAEAMAAHGDGTADSPYEVGPDSAAGESAPGAAPDAEGSYSGPKSKTIDVP
jgi:pilus assembly protein CpaB